MPTYIQWALTTLQDKGYRLQDVTPEIVLQTPWSQVYRFLTHQGYCYLKKVPPALALEAHVIKILQQQFHAPVPFLIADNVEEHCFLMKDGGIPLRDFFKKKFDVEIIIEAIKHHTVLQRAASVDLQLFLDAGVPDWRLAKLPLLYQDLIAQEALLIDDGLTREEFQRLPLLTAKLLSLCEALSRYRIPETLDHADFHDNNILIDTQTHHITLIDLGEVVISHPFFSLLNILHRTKESYALSDPEYQQLQNRVFAYWLDMESQAHLMEIMSIIQQCWSIYAVLGEYRLINSVDHAAFQTLRREGRFAKKLRFWLDA